jgi:hypothetical protein
MEDEIRTKLKESKLSETSINKYISLLKNLNGNRKIINFKFLNNPKIILKAISGYKENTQRNILISIVSVLKKMDNNLYKKYYDLMMDINKKLDLLSKEHKKSDTQEKNWLEWDDVINKFNELNKNIKMSKNISEDQYDIILNTVILGLYVLAPPRRSKDYLLMKIDTKQDDKQFNYLDLKKKQFVFNNYKTNKTYGEQIVNISDDLILLLKKYLKYKKTDNNFLLNKFNGDEIKSDNAITRKLNKIFGKNIASSMLRHIYLSSKYGSVSKEQSEDAKDMGHSLEMQKEYIKK